MSFDVFFDREHKYGVIEAIKKLQKPWYMEIWAKVLIYRFYPIMDQNYVLIYFEIFVTNLTCGKSFWMYFSMLNTNIYWKLTTLLLNKPVKTRDYAFSLILSIFRTFPCDSIFIFIRINGLSFQLILIKTLGWRD